jgi:hypothetical protein
MMTNRISELAKLCKIIVNAGHQVLSVSKAAVKQQ